jgi:hypothetical protein
MAAQFSVVPHVYRQPLPSIDVADALLDERHELTELWNQFALFRV